MNNYLKITSHENTISFLEIKNLIEISDFEIILLTYNLIFKFASIKSIETIINDHSHKMSLEIMATINEKFRKYKVNGND